MRNTVKVSYDLTCIVVTPLGRLLWIEPDSIKVYVWNTWKVFKSTVQRDGSG